MYEGQSDDRKSMLKRVEDDLYARSHKELPIIEKLEEKKYDVQKDWVAETSGEHQERVNTYVKKRRSMVKNILIASLVFFIGAALYAFYAFFGGKSTLSGDNINMSIVGPVSVDAGKEVDLQMQIENKNSANIESAILYIDLPEGATATTDDQQNVTRITKDLGTIAPGELINEKFKATFFGEENKEKKIFVTLEYKFEGSNASLEKKMDHSVLIVSSQVGFTMSMLKEASAGQEIEIVISVDSSTSGTLENLALQMNYPFGFTYTDADPKPTMGQTTWVIDSLEPFGSKEIHIRGVINGEDDNSKVFTADLGVQDTQNPTRLATTYSRAEESVILRRPFIGLQVLVNKQEATQPVIIKNGDTVEVSIPWVNNLDTKIVDMGIEARINHKIVDRSSIKMLNEKGFFNSLDDVAVWDQRTNPDFAVVMPGASGVVGFSFNLGSIVQGGELFKDVEIAISATAKGKRLSDTNVPESTKTPAVGKARLLTSLTLDSRLLYKDGSIKNTGPLPPKANQETTYTVRWQVTNGSSKVSNTVVKTKLPTYVSWKGAVSPSRENVIYDSVSGDVSWNIGDIDPGVGVTSSPREVSFQIGFIPSVTQVGSVPTLITETTLDAVDTFTGSVVNDTEDARTTAITNDSGYAIGVEKVSN